MRIESMSLRGFRSFARTPKRIQFDHFGLIVGENGAGKSNLLRALDVFFNMASNTNLDEHVRWSTGRRPTMGLDLIFVDVPLQLSAQSPFDRYARGGRLHLDFQYNPESGRKFYRVRTLPYQRPSGGAEVLQPEALSVFLNKIRFVYIPSVRDISRHSSYEEKSLYQDLVDAYVDVTAGTGRRAAHLENLVAKRVKEIVDRTAAEPTKALARLLPFQQSPPLSFRPHLSARPADILGGLEIEALEGNRTVDLASLGSGWQSMIYLAVVEALVEYGVDVSVIMGLEEPSNHLHPQHERRLARKLLEKCAGNTSVQILATTHSPIFARGVSYRHVMRACWIGGETVCHQAMPADESRLRELESQSLRHMDEVKASVLFSRAALVVEGAGDRAFLVSALRARGFDPDEQGFSIMSADGKGSIRALAALTRVLDIPIFVICDRDYAGSGNGSNWRQGQLIDLLRKELRLGIAVTKRVETDLRAGRVGAANKKIAEALRPHCCVWISSVTLDRDVVSNQNMVRLATILGVRPRSSADEFYRLNKKKMKDPLVLARIGEDLAPREQPRPVQRLLNSILDFASSLEPGRCI